MRRLHPYELSYLSTSQWSQMPFSALKFDVSKSWLAPLIKQVKLELKQKGLAPFFHVWVSDEWFSPDGCPGIALPYYLFHPSLIRLQRQNGLPVEGATATHALKLIRHEVGHAIENAWRLRRKKQRQLLFGRSSTPYPHSYAPVKDSADYVKHLGHDYAQAHPDEDWAETFAVWLSTSEASWRARYKGTKALEKLEYCHKVMQEIAGTKPLNTERFVVSPIEDTRGTIESFMRIRANTRVKQILRPKKIARLSRPHSSAVILKQAQQWYTQHGLGILM